jgi:hypothetical protein
MQTPKSNEHNRKYYKDNIILLPKILYVRIYLSLTLFWYIFFTVQFFSSKFINELHSSRNRSINKGVN